MGRSWWLRARLTDVASKPAGLVFRQEALRSQTARSAHAGNATFLPGKQGRQAFAPAQRGDTLVEVLLAIVILSMVIVGAVTIMSRGLSAAQLAVEHTQVRLEINSQTEMLRYLRDGYVSDPSSSAGQTWLALFAAASGYANTTASNYNNAATCAVTTGKTGFYLTQTGGVVNLNTFNSSLVPATYATPGQGMWMEVTRSSGLAAGTPAYVDVLIRACWVAGGAAQQQAVTAVRLYDPAH